MSFIFPALLGGLLCVGIPVLLHLIMQQKPKHIPFPAFRFLMQRYRTNQRQLRLRHLILMALRMFLVAAVCLALARPRVLNESLNLSSDQPVAAVLVFDTSYSMEYASGGRSRLEEAKRRAQELLGDLPEGSRVAILDTGESSGEWLPTLAMARERIGGLILRPANGPVTSRLSEAYRLLAELDQEQEDLGRIAARFLYIFSDRAQDCWDQSRLKDLKPLSDRLSGTIRAVFVDVGAEQPSDVAIVSLELPQQSTVRDRMILRATVRAVGQDCDTEVVCRIDGESTAEKKPVKLRAGQSQVISFERRGLAPGLHQAEISLGTTDSLPFDNARFATFEVRGGRRVLVLADDTTDARIWKLALESSGTFQCDVRGSSESMSTLTPKDLLSRYQAVCLVNVAAPSRSLWETLAAYVKEGGGLAIIPGGDELRPAAYNDDRIAQTLLPGQFVKVLQTDTEPGVSWKETTYQHPVLAPFRDWAMSPDVDFLKTPPAVTRYWEVKPYGQEAYVIVGYADQEGRPALLERLFDRKKMRGRVLLYTTPLDDRRFDNGRRRWNDYLQTSFYLVLANKTVGYLAGDAEEASFNFLSGQPITVPLPPNARFPIYRLEGPGIAGTDAIVPRTESQNELVLTQAVKPGNYTLTGESGTRTASFSVNVPPEECQLDKVSAEAIEALLGSGALLPVGHNTNLREALQGHWGQPLELLPWLMIAVLLALALENLLANRFYRSLPVQNEESGTPP